MSHRAHTKREVAAHHLPDDSSAEARYQLEASNDLLPDRLSAAGLALCWKPL
jgi:hypothetical protein